VAIDEEIFWSTCFQRTYLNDEYFDAESQTWVFNWDGWIHEIHMIGTELPHTLKDPEDFPILGDNIDVFILKELEKDPTISFSELAKKLGVTTQSITYRYRRIMKRGLVEGFDASLFPFGNETDYYFFKFDFDCHEKMAKFAMSLLSKPFASVLGKILGENAIVVGIRLPRAEFRNFIDAVSKMAQMGTIKNFKYVIQDLRKVARQTFSYEYFNGQSWTYNHISHLENLHRLVKK